MFLKVVLQELEWRKRGNHLQTGWNIWPTGKQENSDVVAR